MEFNTIWLIGSIACGIISIIAMGIGNLYVAWMWPKWSAGGVHKSDWLFYNIIAVLLLVPSSVLWWVAVPLACVALPTIAFYWGVIKISAHWRGLEGK